MSRVLRLARGRIRDGVAVPPDPSSIDATLGSSNWYVQPGGSSSRSIAVTRTNYTGSISVSVTGLPSGVTAIVTPSTLSGVTLSAVIELSAAEGTGLATNAFSVVVSGAGVDTVTLAASVTVGELVAFGPGPNAPAWVGKTVYPDQRFDAPLPTQDPPDAAGFRAFQGFGSGWAGAPRIEYLADSTPLGSKTVMRMNFKGQTETISANGGTTTPWPLGVTEYQQMTVLIEGTWSGTLQFELSTDGVSNWTPVTAFVEALSGGTHTNGTSTTVNGLWRIGAAQDGSFVRVRASSWTSGTATVRTGVAGGQAPARFYAGGFDGSPTRIYQRVVLRLSSNWTDGGNTGTKGAFFSQRGAPDGNQRNNHYFYQQFNGLALQDSAFNAYAGQVFPFGEWLDCEQILTAGTPGGNNGTAKLWVNGTLVLDQTGIPFFPTMQPAHWDGIFVDPTYGGGARPAPFTIYQDYAYFYRESAA